DGADYAQMKKVAQALRQRLLKVKDVTKVNLYGTQDEKIFVEFSHAKLATLGVTTEQIFQSLARQNAVVSAGVVESSAQRVPLRVTGALDGAKAVAETPVEANGRVFRLGDIATVTHGFADPPEVLVRQKDKPAIGIGVVMAKGADRRHAYATHDSAAKHVPAGARIPHRAARNHRSILGPESCSQAVRLCRIARPDRAGRHDHAQCRDS